MIETKISYRRNRWMFHGSRSTVPCAACALLDFSLLVQMKNYYYFMTAMLWLCEILKVPFNFFRKPTAHQRDRAMTVRAHGQFVQSKEKMKPDFIPTSRDPSAHKRWCRHIFARWTHCMGAFGAHAHIVHTLFDDMPAYSMDRSLFMGIDAREWSIFLICSSAATVRTGVPEMGWGVHFFCQ